MESESPIRDGFVNGDGDFSVINKIMMKLDYFSKQSENDMLEWILTVCKNGLDDGDTASKRLLLNSIRWVLDAYLNGSGDAK